MVDQHNVLLNFDLHVEKLLYIIEKIGYGEQEHIFEEIQKIANQKININFDINALYCRYYLSVGDIEKAIDYHANIRANSTIEEKNFEIYFIANILNIEIQIKSGKIDVATQINLTLHDFLNSLDVKSGNFSNTCNFFLLYLEGEINRLKGQLDGAFEKYAHSLTLLQLDKHPLIHSNILNQMGLSLRLQGKWEMALTYFNKSLNLFPEDEENLEVALSFNNIGVIYFMKSDLDDAMLYFQKSLKIRTKMGTKEDIGKSYNNIAAIYESKGISNKALEYYNKSLAIRIEIGNDQEIAKTINNIGFVYYHQGKFDQALDNFNQALKLFEKYNNLLQISMCYDNLSKIYVEKRDIEKAVFYGEKGLIYRKKIGDDSQIAESYVTLGQLEKLNGNLKEALDYFRNAVNLETKTGNKIGLATSLNYMGYIIQLIGDLKTSLIYFTKSLKISEEIGNTYEIATICHNIGLTYKQLEDFNESRDYLIRAYDLRKQLDNKRKFAETIYSLIVLNIEMGKINDAKVLVDELENLSLGSDDDYINTIYNISKGSVIDDDNEIKSELFIKSMFDTILNEQMINYNLIVPLVIKLDKVLSNELLLREDTNVFEDAIEYLIQLFSLADKNGSYSLVVETLLIQSKLYLIVGKNEESAIVLEQAFLIANDKGLSNLITKVKLQRTILKNKIEIIKINNKLKSANRRLKDYIAIISHDIRLPIQQMQFFSEILKLELTDKLNEDQLNYLSLIEKGSQRVNAMINDLVDFSFIQETKVIEEEIDIYEIISDLQKIELKQIISKKSAIIKTENTLHTIKGNTSQIYRVFQNLIANAIKYTDQDKIPVVTIRSSNKYVYTIYEIEDNGIGIEDDHKEKIFDFGFRVHKKESEDGFGLGLASCKEIIEQHGGKIELLDNPNGGTIFKLYFPI